MSSNTNTKSRQVELSVIIPAYNEGERLGKTLESVAVYLNRQPYSSEILLVDDGSNDNTINVARAYGKHAQMKILRHSTNHGKGWAVRSGMLNASGRYRLFMDADGSTDILHWQAMKDALDGGADVVVGSRHVEGSDIRVHQALHREFLGGLFRGLVQTMFGLPIVDTQNGYKAFTADAADRIFRRQRVPGWAFDVEVLSLAQDLGYSLAEIPIVWVDDSRSRLTLMSTPRMLMELVRIKMGAPQPGEARRASEVPRWA